MKKAYLDEMWHKVYKRIQRRFRSKLISACINIRTAAQQKKYEVLVKSETL